MNVNQIQYTGDTSLRATTYDLPHLSLPNANRSTKDQLKLPNKVLAGYWFQWLSPPEDGAHVHTWPEEIPLEYNMIIVAFMNNGADGIPTFSPDANFLGEQGFLNAMNLWKSQGREVLISLGGAAGHYELRMDQKQAFKDELRRIMNHYGFTGIDLDFENTSIAAGANEIVIPQVLNELKDEFNAQGRKFFITMAPEFPYLRPGGVGGVTYRAYLEQTNYDLIMPQYYNQAGDGIEISSPPWWASNDNLSLREELIYHLTKAIVAGNGMFQVPAEKLAIGLPATPNAAYGQQRGIYYTDPDIIATAMNRLKSAGIDLKGVMTWSINQDRQDIGRSHFDFGHRVGAFLGLPEPGTSGSGETPPPPPEPELPTSPPTDLILTPPTLLHVTGQTQSSISLAWQAPTGSIQVNDYEIFRDGIRIADVPGHITTFTDSDLAPGTTYHYSVRVHTTSEHSNTVTGTTETSAVTTPELLPPTHLSVTHSAITLNWQLPITTIGITGYRIYRNHVMVGEVGPQTTQFIDTGLIPHTTYTYTIASFDTFGNEAHTQPVNASTVAS